MIGQYRPGNSVLHRMPTGLKLGLIALVVLGISLGPAQWWFSLAALVLALAGYALAGFGPREVWRQLRGLWWLAAFPLITQLIFVGPLAAITTTGRVFAAIMIATLISLTTRTTDLLQTLERMLSPLRRIGVDTERIALLLSLTLTMIPVIARLAAAVRDACRARTGRGFTPGAVVTLLVASLRHADQTAEALVARGMD